MGGVAVELVHLASLYHDDVIDEATIRRNVESVNSRFGNLVAIVAGDYLLARSRRHRRQPRAPRSPACWPTPSGRLCQGQVTEVRSAFQIGRSRDDYFAAISGQDGGAHGHLVPHRRAHRRAARRRGRGAAPSSAAASAWCSRSATTSSTSPPPTASSASRPGQDLAEGIYTLPALVALADPDAGPDLRALLGQPLAQPERDKARAIVVASRASPSRSTRRAAYVDGRQGGRRRDRRAANSAGRG